MIASKAEIAVEVLIRNETVVDLLCSALEGQSNYWCRIASAQYSMAWLVDYNAAHNAGSEQREAKLRACDGTRARLGISCRWDELIALRLYSAPLEDGWFILEVEGGDEPDVKIDRAAIERGLKLAIETGCMIFVDDRSPDADGFLQLCAFGRRVYA